jgi:hypothetical protein
VLFGKVNPSAKLPITWPRKLDDFPSCKSFAEEVDTVYVEGFRVGYRYFDHPGTPTAAFPFGFGLSYTTFKYGYVWCLLKRPVQNPDDCRNLTADWTGETSLRICFDVTNTGQLAGAEAAQIYIHQCDPPVDRPDMELAGFAKANLAPGETKRLTVMLDVSLSSTQTRWTRLVTLTPAAQGLFVLQRHSQALDCGPGTVRGPPREIVSAGCHEDDHAAQGVMEVDGVQGTAEAVAHRVRGLLAAAGAGGPDSAKM